LAGFVDVMRQRATPVPLDLEERAELVDIVGTGGGGPLTFNISSGAALSQRQPAPKWPSTATAPSPPAAARQMSSKPSAVPIELSPELAAECLRQTGFMFLYAPLTIPP